MKRTLLVCFALLAAGALFAQEPVNHAVTQPSIAQPIVSQPTTHPLLNVLQPSAYQPVVSLPALMHEPLPEYVTHPEQPVAHEPVAIQPRPPIVKDPVIPRTVQPVAKQRQIGAATCGCNSQK